MMRRACRQCQRQIVLIETPNGRHMALNAETEKRWIKFKGGVWSEVETYTDHKGACTGQKKH